MVVQTELVDFLKNYHSHQIHSLFASDHEKGQTVVETLSVSGRDVPVFINEFWTSKQRQANSLHEVPYRACFKAQLPGFFIELFTESGDSVYDPFAGRGTTAIEAGLRGRKILSNDVNPLSEFLTRARLTIPDLSQLEQRLESIELGHNSRAERDLTMFYHPDTESELVELRRYLIERSRTQQLDPLDQWIRMVATTRLTGHSTGFFSVYTLPPNQAVTPKSQRRINEKRNQKPSYKPVKPRILKKSRRLLRDVDAQQAVNLRQVAESALFLQKDARRTTEIEANRVDLTVTSPPFLDVVDYSENNWLRCWFHGIDVEKVEAKMTNTPHVEGWTEVMREVFHEFYRITKPSGWVAFEVGEIRDGTIKLDEHVVPLGLEAGFECPGILINQQEFTKTSNIWGVDNNAQGTNTNRVVLFRK